MVSHISLVAVEPHEFRQTLGRDVADAVARKIGQRDFVRYSAALHAIARQIDSYLTKPGVAPQTSDSAGGTFADNAVAGEAIILFADAHPRRGFEGGLARIGDVAASRSAAMGGRRLQRANSIARHIWRSISTRTVVRATLEERQRSLIELAAALLDEDDLARLDAMTECVPIIAVVGDTRSTGPTSGRFHLVVASLPGRWLGTAPVAGRC
ncbi:hypothetical protein [Methylobacterium trifolii]|uniref:Uncharacterized protein n=1 Tax=Methylobacterium trifolii TaxID=1003092 RepID=A0ABQ4U2E7_9HYPH|nr:hypothetical protein [Methylobacterium trifolii]GJE60517.1 hypothetical protein MPOCJGCO_2629 [Methylobacterium trifolii]